MGSSPCLPLHSQGSQISSQRSLLSALTLFIFLNLNPYVLCTCIVCLKSSSSGLCMPHWFILLYISVKNLPFTTRSKIGTVCYSLLHQRLLFTSHILAPNPIHFSFGILNNLKLLLLISLIFFFSLCWNTSSFMARILFAFSLLYPQQLDQCFSNEWWTNIC